MYIYIYVYIYISYVYIYIYIYSYLYMFIFEIGFSVTDLDAWARLCSLARTYGRCSAHFCALLQESQAEAKVPSFIS